MKINNIVKRANDQVIENVWNIERRSINKYEAGERMTGFKIYAFEPETTNPKTTYMDQSSISFVSPHPIILDSKGQAEIHGNGKYKIMVEDCRGAIFFIADDVDGDMGEE